MLGRMEQDGDRTVFRLTTDGSLIVNEGVTRLTKQAIRVKKDKVKCVVLPETLRAIERGACDFSQIERLVFQRIPDRMSQTGLGMMCGVTGIIEVPDGTDQQTRRLLRTLCRSQAFAPTRLRVRDPMLVPPRWRDAAVCCAAEDGLRPGTPRDDAYLRYIGKHGRHLLYLASICPELLRVMLAQGLLRAEDFDLASETAEKLADPELTAELLNYKFHRLAPQAYRRAQRRQERDQELVARRSFERMGRTGVAGLRIAVQKRELHRSCIARDLGGVKRYLKELGAAYAAKITAKVDLYICERRYLAGEDLAEAKRLGIEVVDWRAFLAMTGEVKNHCLVHRGTAYRVLSRDWDGVIPDGTEIIDSGLLRSFHAPHRVVVPKGVRIIRENAFSQEQDLETIELPDTLVEIGDGAFCSCYCLRAVNLPQSVQRIGRGAFEHTASAARVRLNVRDAAQYLDLAPEFEHTLYMHDKPVTDLVIPEGTTEIPDGAGKYCRTIRTLTTPTSLRRIGTQAFYASTLTEVRLADGPTEIGWSAFGDCAGMKRMRLPGTLRSLSTGALAGCPELEWIEATGTDREQMRDIFGTLYASAWVRNTERLRLAVHDPMCLPAPWRNQALITFAEQDAPVEDARGRAHLACAGICIQELREAAAASPALMRLLCDNRLIPDDQYMAFSLTAKNSPSLEILLKY